ncbi:MAG: class D sortase [Terracidiphilus sp.]
MTERRALVWGQYLFLAVGFVAIGYCAIVVSEAERYQVWAREHLGELHEASTTTKAADAISRQRPPSGREPTLVGRIDIPRVHISAMVAEGTSSRVLRLAVGHMPGTALPGESGNVVLAAHRDTFFRRLGELKSGDVIRLAVPGRHYVYSVRFADIVSPNETWVLEPSPGQSLTLVTCYPFYFVGPAPKRFVIRARRRDTD